LAAEASRALQSFRLPTRCALALRPHPTRRSECTAGRLYATQWSEAAKTLRQSQVRGRATQLRFAEPQAAPPGHWHSHLGPGRYGVRRPRLCISVTRVGEQGSDENRGHVHRVANWSAGQTFLITWHGRRLARASEHDVGDRSSLSLR
jgi:hypothetical protein